MKNDRNGYRNPILGHRGFWSECKFWYRSSFNGSVPTNELAYKRGPDGLFWAVEVGDYVVNDQALASAVFDSYSVTLKTREDISSLKKKDVVEYDGKIWIVQGIRKHRIRQFYQMYKGYDLYEYSIMLSR